MVVVVVVEVAAVAVEAVSDEVGRRAKREEKERLT